MAGEPEANFLKIILLLMKYGSKVLQQKIEYELRNQKWQKVTDFLRERKHDILHLTNKRCCIKDCGIKDTQNAKKCLIHYSLLELMYEDVKRSCSTRFYHCCSCHFVPKSDLDINVWDITLTSCLLLELIGFDDPKTCEGQKQAIQNLRNLRNSKELLHRGNAEMEDDEYNKMWLKLSNNIKEVAHEGEPYFYAEHRKNIDNMYKTPLTQEQSYNAYKCWRELKNVKDCQNGMSKQRTVPELLGNEVENIYYYSETCLEEHKENSDMYVEPRRAINHCLKALEHHRLIVITGVAGSGKTRFGLELMSRMQNKHQSFTALILTKCSQWDILDLTKEYIFFIDDMLGKSSADDGAYQSWSTAFDPMLKLLNKGHVYLIFALRNNIWYLMKERFSEYTLFRLLGSSNGPVDLSGVVYGLTSQEKLRMLKKFCRHYDVQVCETLQEERRSFECSDDNSVCLSEKTLEIIAGMDITSGLPFLCEQFFSQKKSLRKIFNFFKDYSARDFVKEQIDQLLSEKKDLQYVVLVYFFLKDKSFEVDSLLKVKKEIVQLGIGMGKSTEIRPATLRGCLKDMLNKFISSSDGVYRLKHMVVYEAVLLSFGENFPEKFLELITKSVLFTYVRSKGYVAGDHEVVVQLDDDMTESLAKKLIDVYGSNKEEAYSDVYKHPSFHDKRLVDCFLDISEREESFKIFLKSFLAGACKENKDILASEVIRRFSNSFEFESDILDLILNNDLIYAFRQYMYHSDIIMLFSKHYVESFNEDFGLHKLFMEAFQCGARQCIMEMLNYLDKENDLETDCDKNNITYLPENTSISFLYDIVIHHDPSCGNDWTDVLTKLAELCPSHEEREEFYRIGIRFAVMFEVLDIVFVLLERIQSISYRELEVLMKTIFRLNQKDLYDTLSRKMKSVNLNLTDLKSAELIMKCVLHGGNENMFNVFLNEFPCSFYHVTDRGNTILYVCERKNFSDSCLLRLLRRPEGKFVFTFVNKEGRTPVQYRAAYKNVRREVNKASRGSSDCLCVCEIDWRDDTLLVNSSFKDRRVHNVVWSDDTLIENSTFKNLNLQDNVWWNHFDIDCFFEYNI